MSSKRCPCVRQIKTAFNISESTASEVYRAMLRYRPFMAGDFNKAEQAVSSIQHVFRTCGWLNFSTNGFYGCIAETEGALVKTELVGYQVFDSNLVYGPRIVYDARYGRIRLGDVASVQTAIEQKARMR